MSVTKKVNGLFMDILKGGERVFDIHCHILPGVDDGSGNLNDSIEMAQLAAESGTVGIIATPHCNIPGVFDNYWCSEFRDNLQRLRKALSEKNIPVEIYQGQEIFLSKYFEERLEKRDFITLNNSRYMLTEFDFRIDEATAISRLESLASHGYVPVVAHPERYGFVIENPAVIKKIRSLGALIQVNAGSIIGDFGLYIKKTAEKIIGSALADFVASDAHSQYSRTPNLAYIHEFISENYSYDYADILIKVKPIKVINNETI